jgi:hypothetical protein
MFRPDSIITGALIAFALCGETIAQERADGPGTPARKKLSELRSDEPSTPDAAASTKAAPAEAGKKAADAVDPKTSFFGDTTKFTRISGWGSFGNAMGQFGFARTTLIMLPPIQEELKLTDEQKKKLKEWQEGLRKKGEEMGRSMREKNGEDPFRGNENQPITARVLQFTSMLNQVSTFMKSNEDGLAKILNAPQRKRLNQISLQMEGVSALMKPEIVESLGMLEEQVEQIQAVLNQSRTQQMTTWIGSMMAMRPPRPPATDPARPKPETAPEDDAKARLAREKAMKQRFDTMRNQTDQIHGKAVKQITDLLTRSQRAKFEIMLGPPFDPAKLNNLGRPPRLEGEQETKEPTPDSEKTRKSPGV